MPGHVELTEEVLHNSLVGRAGLPVAKDGDESGCLSYEERLAQIRQGELGVRLPRRLEASHDCVYRILRVDGVPPVGTRLVECLLIEHLSVSEESVDTAGQL